MQRNILNKAISLIIAMIFILSLSLSLVACNSLGDSDETGSDSGNNEGADNSDGPDDSESQPKEDYHDKIKVPAYKDFGRDTINFSEINYSRPDFESVISSFSNIVAAIEENKLSFEEQLQMIVDLEDEYNHVLTMYAFSNIFNSKDASSAFWNEEYSYVTSNYPSFAEIIEDMFVAAANSPHAERFEDEYFGEGLIEEYKDGGTFTEKMIELWAIEEELEAEYSSISTATVIITYKNVTDTVDNILKYYLDSFGETSTEYVKAYTVCMKNYEDMTDEKSREIFVDLIKVRREIATELGHESYLEYGYKVLGRDYSAEQISDFLDGIAEYIVPVYSILSCCVFSPYFSSNEPSDITLDELINNGYDVISAVDPELGDIYHYMLQHGLYDVEINGTNREQGAFTTYLDSYNAPFIFMSASGNITDYSTLIHEFGHFADEYINYNSSTSIDQKEVSSQGLEYLMLLSMEDTLSIKDLQYLNYSKLLDALETLIFQGFYAKFEELIYELPLESITEEKLNEQVVKAAELFKLNTEYINDMSVAFIPHTFLYPFYVQSYCVSIVPALQLYFAEREKDGAGFEAYKIIIDRNDKDLTFEETIVSAGLKSPFDEGVLKDIADKIYYYTVGQHFYEDKNNSSNDLNAA